MFDNLSPVILATFRKFLLSSLYLFIFCFFIASVAYASPPLVSTAPGVDCSIAETAIELSSRLRKLSVKHIVPCKLQGKSEVESYLRQALSKKVPKVRMESEGRVYQLLGVIPPEYDYINGLIRLYTEQLGGYYDPDSQFYVMANWLPLAMQMPIAVHELTHALQDQHFDLDTLMDQAHDDSDTLVARSALVEGDATAVMLDYARSINHLPSIAQEESVSGFMMQNITGAMLSSGLGSAPTTIQAMMIFPYVSGLNFAHKLLQRKGYAGIDEAFRRPPASTEEILHPSIYESKKKSFVVLPAPKAPTHSPFERENPVFQDCLGEFFIATMLTSWLPPPRASLAAAGWGGDRIAFYEKENSNELYLAWESNWDTAKDAREFFEALCESYTKRFQKGGRPLQPTDSACDFQSAEIGSSQIKLDKTRVFLSIEAKKARS